MTSQVIAFTGYARVGKSTAAAALATTHTRVGISDPLKLMAEDMNPIIGFDHQLASYFGVSPEKAPLRLSSELSVYGWDGVKDRYPEARYILKGLGEAARTHLGSNIWLTAWLTRMFEHPRVVCDDLRFLNEAQGFRDVFGKKALIVRIDRPGVGPESDFEKEVNEIDVDVVIVNDGTIDALKARARAVAQRHGPVPCVSGSDV